MNDFNVNIKISKCFFVNCLIGCTDNLKTFHRIGIHLQIRIFILWRIRGEIPNFQNLWLLYKPSLSEYWTCWRFLSADGILACLTLKLPIWRKIGNSSFQSPHSRLSISTMRRLQKPQKNYLFICFSANETYLSFYSSFRVVYPSPHQAMGEKVNFVLSYFPLLFLTL